MPSFSSDIKNQAKELYLKDLGVDRIAAELKKAGITPSPSKSAIHRWIKINRWEDLRKKVNEKQSEKLVETLSDVKSRQIKIAKATLSKYVTDLHGGKVDVSPEAAKRWAEHELLLWGELTDRVGVQSVNITVPQWFKKENKDETKTEEEKQ